VGVECFPCFGFLLSVSLSFLLSALFWAMQCPLRCSYCFGLYSTSHRFPVQSFLLLRFPLLFECGLRAHRSFLQVFKLTQKRHDTLETVLSSVCWGWEVLEFFFIQFFPFFSDAFHLISFDQKGVMEQFMHACDEFHGSIICVFVGESGGKVSRVPTVTRREVVLPGSFFFCCVRFTAVVS